MNDGITVPTIRFELEGIRHTVLRCLLDRANDVEACVNTGIDAALTQLPESIAAQTRHCVFESVRDVVAEVLRDQVAKYFDEGPGYDMIAELIKSRLHP